MIHTIIKPYSCKYCFKKIRHSAALKEHERNHNGPKGLKGNKNQDCAYCEEYGKFFQFEFKLTQHLIANTAQKHLNTSKTFKTMKKLKPV